MCGISGILGEWDEALARQMVETMNASIAHRGPDAEGVWHANGVTLGHRRLSIIDTSPESNQPFLSDDNQLAIVFNGEIYNYLELRKELEAEFSFRTHSDTEVILAAYRRWGIDCIKEFVGMFAFALYDKSVDKVFIVRDRLGVKPLYYSQVSDRWLFASELRAILSTELVPRKISQSGLLDYLKYQTVHSPDTIVEGVKMLKAGHYLVICQGESQEKPYWDVARQVKKMDPDQPRAEVLRDISSALRSSVELRMRADVPFGAFLSGGIDSSIIVGLMAEISPHPVRTFSVTFGEKEWDESPYSNMIAKRFHTDHQEIRLTADQFCQLIPDALMAMDHPSGDGPNTYVVSKATREQGVKMALSGLGGDEVFAGYGVFQRMMEMKNRQWLSHTPRFIRSISAKALSALNPSVASEKIAAILNEPAMDFAHAYPFSRRVLMDDRIAELLRVGNHFQDPVSVLAKKTSLTGLPLLSQVSVAEMGSYMQNVLLRDADQMSMAHALEVREPFLDHRLIELVLGVSDEMKFPHTPKQLLTDSMHGLIPDEVIHRPKMGFTFPWKLWMKNELRSMCEENLQYLRGLEHFHADAIQKLWNDFIKDDPRVSWSRVWPLVVLGAWMKRHRIV